jgi:hypothetical protein
VSIGINGDIEKIKTLEDNILEQYNKNVELANKMEQETEKFAKQANTAIEDYNSNAETKAEEFNTNAKEKTDEFNSNATEKKTEISDIADVFDANVEEKTNTFNSNVETKTTEFNNNSNAKTEEFNNNSTEKINNFNSNAEEKIADYNKHVETLTSRIADLEEETEDLFNALNTEKASGNELYIDDAKACRVISSEIDGMYQQETTTGKNLLDVKTITVSLVAHKLPETLEAGEYVFSCDNVNQEVGVRLSETTDTNSNSVVVRSSTVVGDRQILKIKTTFTSNYINISSVNVTLTNMMLEVGTTATDYEPYTGRSSISKSGLSAKD